MTTTEKDRFNNDDPVTFPLAAFEPSFPHARKVGYKIDTAVHFFSQDRCLILPHADVMCCLLFKPHAHPDFFFPFPPFNQMFRLQLDGRIQRYIMNKSSSTSPLFPSRVCSEHRGLFWWSPPSCWFCSCYHWWSGSYTPLSASVVSHEGMACENHSCSRYT